MKTKGLLQKPHWNYTDVMKYCDVKKSKAYELMALCRKKYNGTIKDFPSCVRRDSVLALLGTTLEQELKVFGDD